MSAIAENADFTFFVTEIKTKIASAQYKENTKLQTLSAEIGRSHNVAIFQKAKDKLEIEFYGDENE
ncbi:MAG: hypothetical protein RBR33_04170 [Sulfurovaceae bacterium]|nr:hypothetical protein [Sulfurovaceae bacterium]